MGLFVEAVQCGLLTGMALVGDSGDYGTSFGTSKEVGGLLGLIFLGPYGRYLAK